MISEANSWERAGGLAVGEHVHLQELIEHAPPAGSRDWLPILQQLIAYLVGYGGNWLVVLRAGTASSLPAVPVTAANVFDFIDSPEQYEPPAVYNVGDKLFRERWEGEQHSWKQTLDPGVRESVEFARPRGDLPEGDGWLARVTFEIRSDG